MTNGKLGAVIGRKNTIIQPRNAVKMYRMADTYLPIYAPCTHADGRGVYSHPVKR